MLFSSVHLVPARQSHDRMHVRSNRLGGDTIAIGDGLPIAAATVVPAGLTPVSKGIFWSCSSVPPCAFVVLAVETPIHPFVCYSHVGG